MKIGISACLTGKKVRYDGTDRKNEELFKLLEGHETVTVCPEVAAGFPIPRKKIEMLDERIITETGTDISETLEEGCVKCLEMIRDCDIVILKSRSPSCGCGKIYDGSFSGKLVQGNGAFAALCIANNLAVYTEEDLEAIRKALSDK